MKTAILPLARPTFDVEFAKEKLAAMLAMLKDADIELCGSQELLPDEASASAALEQLGGEKPDLLLILQLTFTDAAMVAAAAKKFDGPLAIWAVPEPRSGGRLRLNSFCGLNLASHALSLINRDFCWIYSEPEATSKAQLTQLLHGERTAGKLAAMPAGEAGDSGKAIAASLAGKKIARIGTHPAGFDTCSYEADDLRELAGVEVLEFELSELFSRADGADDAKVREARATAADSVEGLDRMDQAALDKSLRLKAALDSLREQGGFAAFALRCWPETFTEHGGALCAPAAMLGEAGVPCACEADVYGALSQLLLREIAGEAVFLTDLVDVDEEDDTAVVWHCGQAPISMRDPETQASATIHSNRKLPLLFEFPLKPGPITLARISKGHNEPKLVIAAAEMLRRPLPFSGTAGVLRFDKPASQMLEKIIAAGLEHHTALAYGDHLEELRAAAASLGMPILEL